MHFALCRALLSRFASDVVVKSRHSQWHRPLHSDIAGSSGAERECASPFFFWGGGAGGGGSGEGEIERKFQVEKPDKQRNLRAKSETGPNSKT